MEYTIKSHPTKYSDVLFRSRLEARYAAFFDLIGWEWEYEPLDIEGWTPDFRVKFLCYHSECSGYHTLLVEVKPYYDINKFQGHPCWSDFIWSSQDAPAAFGIKPEVSRFQLCHGAGGGLFTIQDWIEKDIKPLWKMAGNITRYYPKPV